MNQAMQNPDSLLEQTINIYNQNGNPLGECDLATAKHLVASRRYYVMTTQDIILKGRKN